MTYGTIFKSNVTIGTLNLGECTVTTGLDGTMTVKFTKGNISLDTLNEVFQSSPMVTIGEESEQRNLQAYRVDNQGNAEVSFLTNFVVETEEEPIEVESEVENE